MDAGSIPYFMYSLYIYSSLYIIGVGTDFVYFPIFTSSTPPFCSCSVVVVASVLRMNDETSSARHVKRGHVEEWTHEPIIDCRGD